MAQVTGEMQAKEKGVRTLESVDRKLSTHGTCNEDDVSVLVEEMRNVQRTVALKEQEKDDLIEALVRLKENMTTRESNDVSFLGVPHLIQTARITHTIPHHPHHHPQTAVLNFWPF